MRRLLLTLWGIPAIRTRRLTYEEATTRITDWKAAYGINAIIKDIPL